MTVSEAIKKIRVSMCLEQAEFARLVGVSAPSISHYERGSRKPRWPIIRQFLAIAKKHKIKVTYEDFGGE